MKKYGFHDVWKELGLGLAVVLFYKTLKKDFFEKLTFFEWREIYLCSENSSDLQKISFQKMLEMANSSKEWTELYFLTRIGSSEEQVSYQKIMELTYTFSAWLWVYRKSIRAPGLRSVAFEKMLGTAHTIKQYKILYQLSDPQSDARKYILQNLKNLVF